jgi:hypothetical protein
MNIRVLEKGSSPLGKEIHVQLGRFSYVGILKEIDIRNECIVIEDRFYKRSILDMTKVEFFAFMEDKKER